MRNNMQVFVVSLTAAVAYALRRASLGGGF